jgi:hypothetical protein
MLLGGKYLYSRIVLSILHIWKHFLNSSFIFSINIQSSVTRISDSINLTIWHQDLIEWHKETIMAIVYPWHLLFWASCCVTGLSDISCQRVKKQILCITCDVVNVVSIKTVGMWHVMLCSFVGRYQYSGGICVESCLVWRWKQPAPTERWYKLLNYITPYHRRPVMSVHGPAWQYKLLWLLRRNVVYLKRKCI